MVTILLTGLGLLLAYYMVIFGKDIYENRANLGEGNFLIAGGIGFVTDFLDTLGIGSFAPTTLLFKLFKSLKSDDLLPGTLNVSHTIPVMIEAFIFITVVKVEPLTLFSLIVAAIVGSWIGSKTVTKLPERNIQLVMGIALIVTAALMALKQLGMLEMLGEGNTALGLTGGALIIGIVGNFIFGALMTVGVGLYAPCMAMVYMLGMSPIVALPIMMGSCAGLMPVASAEFVKAGKYSRKTSLGIIVGGTIGVIVAAKFVVALNLDILTWIIVCVVLYTGVSMFLKAMKTKSVLVES
ncbi:sulfite exporter TauE/SafE family protein [uncultured Vagococcus sp.]|uniref:sulfite exporter TauE/SafE family protein n=1 Tax=uncultured Vagococcus sp. TaxID=189676 RepID=UPI0028D5852A|nr:sulfite exporter TauE/SafE family protein [uncultured Vagococcus sp.]